MGHFWFYSWKVYIDKESEMENRLNHYLKNLMRHASYIEKLQLDLKFVIRCKARRT